VPWMAVTTLAVTSAVLAAVIFATGQWLLLVSVGATLEAGIYALASVSLLILRKREDRDRPFRLVFGKPLAVIGAVLFTVFALATGFADPANSRHFSLAPIGVIAVLAALSAAYVRFGVPRLRAAHAARQAAAARPKRRPPRPSAEAPVDPTAGSSEP
jgi:amino acid transporter